MMNVSSYFSPGDDGKLVGDGDNLLSDDGQLLSAVFVQAVFCYDPYKLCDGLATGDDIFSRCYKSVLALQSEMWENCQIKMER